MKITIGLKHYDGPACGFLFVDSVCLANPEDHAFFDKNLERLKALFPGTTTDEVEAVDPLEEKRRKKAEKRARKKAEAEAAAAVGGEKPAEEADDASAEESAAQPDADTAKDNA